VSHGLRGGKPRLGDREKEVKRVGQHVWGRRTQERRREKGQDGMWEAFYINNCKKLLHVEIEKSLSADKKKKKKTDSPLEKEEGLSRRVHFKKRRKGPKRKKGTRTSPLKWGGRVGRG